MEYNSEHEKDERECVFQCVCVVAQLDSFH